MAATIVTLMLLCLLPFYAALPQRKENHQQDPPSCGYASCPAGKPEMINVHIVSHTHDDVGWLKTVDQYYYGARNDIQIAGVQYILDSVIQALQDDPARKFIYVETAFFWRWWLQQDDLMHHTVHRLVNEGRLEFVSGGWSMNDEAVCHYSSIIENFAWGLRKLNDTFGPCGRPKVGWQIDPFGHSKGHASILALSGFDGLFLGRIDYQDKLKRQNAKTMEMIWQSSASLGKSGDLFTGVLPNNYSPPSGFCFDLLCNDQPIMDDPRLEDYNVVERVNTFIEVVQNQSKQYATNHLIITMGNDFNYQNAHVWFKNLDKLIKYVNERQTNGSKVNLFYSTPSCYLHALNLATSAWTTKQDDFFPYASGEHTYWTGYYTSRPAIKRLEREASSFLQVCKQVDALAQLGPLDQHDVTVLREAVGVAQHHDAVTGTEQQHVANDYALRLSKGIKECQEAVADGINKIAKPPTPLDFKYCDLLNISQCEITENIQQVALFIWNPLGRNVNPYISLPVVDGSYEISVTGQTTPLPFQLTPLPKSILSIPGRVSNATHEIVFRVKLPPIGYASYNLKKIAKAKDSEEHRSSVIVKRSSGFFDEEFTVKNDFISLTFDQASGILKSLTNLETNDTVALNQTFGYYVGSIGNNSNENFRASGAYIFRPNCTKPGCLKTLAGNESYEIVKGPLMQEVRQYVGPWVSQIIRLYATSRHVDFEWQVGPIPIGDCVGKEIVSRFQTDLQSELIFYTDSNGRENIKRTRDFRPTFDLNLTEPISSNYYPVVSQIFIKDEAKGTQLTILTDRAQGGASLAAGELELMIHRRLLVDDWLGVTEPLNEAGFGEGLVVKGTHRLLFSKITKSPRRYRILAHNLYWHPQLLFAAIPANLPAHKSGGHFLSTYTATSAVIPENLGILSIEQWKGSSLLIRLEHIFEKDEDPDFSKPVTIDLQDVLRDMKITSVREMTLDGNFPLNSVHRLKWSKKGEADPENHLSTDQTSTVVMLNPMEIRTFQIEIA